jgi:type II secretory pathway component PulF
MTAASGSFFFVATKPDGGRAMGVRQARDRRQLAETLRRERLLLQRSYELPAWASQERGLSVKDRVALNEQLAQLLSRGVPLVEALEVTASAVAGGARPRVEKMRELVASGSSFADAAARAGGFDGVTVSVYRAAERTGDLAGAAKQLASTARRQLAIQGKAATLMIYPAIVLSISLIVSMVMLTVIVPKLGEALRSMGAEMPTYSKIVIGFGEWLRANIVWFLMGVGVLLIGALVVRKRLIAGLWSLMRRLPLMREVVLAQESARFFSTMAAMTRSGIPLADALGVANDAIGHPTLRGQLVDLRGKLIDGGVLRTLLDRVTTLPLATRRLLVAADRAGDMESAFESLATDMSDELDRRSARLLAFIEPLLIVGMFLMIGTLLLSIMIPLITMTSKSALG